MEFKDINDVTDALIEILDWLSNNGYMDDIMYRSNMENMRRDGIVTISLNKPELRPCRICGRVHGRYKSVQDATDVLMNPTSLLDCQMAAKIWLEENTVKKGEKEDGHG